MDNFCPCLGKIIVISGGKGAGPFYLTTKLLQTKILFVLMVGKGELLAAKTLVNT